MLSQEPVFVVGVFRSGTSLLSSILNQNPKIALMYECDVWNFPRRLLDWRFKRNWAERIEFYNQTLSRHKLVTAENFSILKRIREPRDLYQKFGEMKGAVVVGEKSPFYCDRLVFLHKIYPKAAFVYVWRDPLEVYRSVLKAGKTSRFFGRPGILSRMIYHQEQAIFQINQIEKAGGRVFRTSYTQIVDETEKTCRELCGFLVVPYDAQMLHLNKADLSSIYREPHHAFLRRGIIERQKYESELVSPAAAQKLARYRSRWQRLQSGSLKPAAAAGPEPMPVEFAYHNFAGRALTFYDALVRAGFEFLPLGWLRVYRLFKFWVINPPSGSLDEKTSMVLDFKQHWHTIGTAAAMMTLVIFIHIHSNPHLMFIPFYTIPCILLALLVNIRWATLFVLIATIAPQIVQYDGDPDYRSTGVLVWNTFARFIFILVIALTAGRIRRDFARTDPSRIESPAAPMDHETK